MLENSHEERDDHQKTKFLNSFYLKSKKEPNQSNAVINKCCESTRTKDPKYCRSVRVGQRKKYTKSKMTKIKPVDKKDALISSGSRQLKKTNDAILTCNESSEGGTEKKMVFTNTGLTEKLPSKSESVGSIMKTNQNSLKLNDTTLEKFLLNDTGHSSSKSLSDQEYSTPLKIDCSYDCPQTQNTSSDNSNHQNDYERTEKVNKCPYCAEEMDDYSTLQLHISKKHEHQMPFICSICCKGHQTKRSLNYHLKAHDKAKRRWKCPFCEMSVTNQFDFTTHLKLVHKKMQCLRCKKLFEEEKDFNVHVDICKQRKI